MNDRLPSGHSMIDRLPSGRSVSSERPTSGRSRIVARLMSALIRVPLVALAPVLVLALASLVPRPVAAHGLHPGVLTLVEHEPGLFTLAWTEPVDTNRVSASVELEFPEPCRPQGDQLDCRGPGLHGAIALRGPALAHVRVLTLVRFLDGRTVEAMLTADSPRVLVDQAPGRSPWAWVRLGVEHILGGLDHLAFVLGLLLVIGTRDPRRLVATITAFTLAHSITLGLAATGMLRLSAAPVEATIAASVLLVAREATHDRPTLTRRAPWAVAFGFGLVHGLGFAGALGTWGLPDGWVGQSLLWLNLGIELGQLAVIVAMVVVVRVVGRRLGPLRPLATYAIGSLAAWWLLERTLAIVTAGS